MGRRLVAVTNESLHRDPRAKQSDETEAVIFVDTTVWIDYVNGTITPQVQRLHDALGNEAIAIGDLIALELLQGFREDRDYKTARDMLDALTVYNLLDGDAAIRCADNYRKLRKRGITVKENADLIIATFCIRNGFPLLFSDRDFLPFVGHLGLKGISGLTCAPIIQ